MTDATAPDYFVVIDFGTVYTRVAILHSGSSYPVFVQKWPGGTGPEVPSLIVYNMSNPAIYRWGFQATVSPQDQPNVLSYLKLLLQYPSGIVPNLSGGQTSSPAAKTAAILLRIETSPERAVSDFLAGLRGPIDAALAEVFGAQTVAASTVRYVFTVSPNWDDPAKAHLIAAIEAAGYGTHRVDFNLVGDTDAAAAIALKQSHGVLQPGDTFVVCNAGAGTVDIIAHKIVSLDPLHVREAVPGIGALCGSIFLDQAFEDSLKRTLGDGFLSNLTPTQRAHLLRTWIDKVKEHIGDTDTCKDGFEFFINRLEGTVFQLANGMTVESPDIRGLRIHLTPDYIHKEIYDPIVNAVGKLLTEQINTVIAAGENAKAILLTGGLGYSPHLFQALHNITYPGTTKPEIIVPVDGRGAIAYGAVINALAAIQRELHGTQSKSFSVTHKFARRHYGNSFFLDYTPGETYNEGWEAHKHWSDPLGVDIVDNNLNWFINKNILVPYGAWFSKDFSFRFNFNATGAPDREASVQLLASDVDQAPVWNEPHVVHSICSMTLNFSNLTRDFPDVEVSNIGSCSFSITYKLNMRVIGEMLEFTCTSKDGQRQLGGVAAKFETA